MMSPREAVLVDFDDEEVAITPASIDLYHLDQLDASLENLETLASPSPPVSREKLMRLCAQKLVRALFTCSTEYFACALPATKLHIAVLAERQHTRLPGFLPKQQFKLRLPKDKRGTWTHCLTICSSNGGSRMQKDLQHPAAEQTQSGDTSIVTSDTGIHSSSEQSSAKSSDSDMVWYVLEKPIAGFSEVINTLGGQ
ncbi:unnamed protein product [Peronospora belbahrii]|uniref:Uncharacterized protein n=1 Tax=Peronospora belbahrii TaxID=622444 RepID=A0AAU9KJX1_9STRA|nr:unnamed protein product [Peronospora belbahrii]